MAAVESESKDLKFEMEFDSSLRKCEMGVGSVGMKRTTGNI
jgi:hypothetical protein